MVDILGFEKAILVFFSFLSPVCEVWKHIELMRGMGR